MQCSLYERLTRYTLHVYCNFGFVFKMFIGIINFLHYLIVYVHIDILVFRHFGGI